MSAWENCGQETISQYTVKTLTNLIIKPHYNTCQPALKNKKKVEILFFLIKVLFKLNKAKQKIYCKTTPFKIQAFMCQNRVFNFQMFKIILSAFYSTEFQI